MRSIDIRRKKKVRIKTKTKRLQKQKNRKTDKTNSRRVENNNNLVKTITGRSKQISKKRRNGKLKEGKI